MNVKEITIGSQVWMSKNLSTSTFLNGDPIPEAKTPKEWEKAGKSRKPAWCSYENKNSNDKKYGKLYNWYALVDPRGIIPDGWAVPNEDCFLTLIEHLGGEDEAGTKMKSTDGWTQEGNGDNLSGFNGLPGGYRASDGNFYELKERGNWWTSDQHDNEYAYLYWLSDKYSYPYRSLNEKANGYSVRCIQSAESTMKPNDTIYSSNLNAHLGSTENEILQNELELEHCDLSLLQKEMTSLGIQNPTVFSTLETLKDDSSDYLYCDFFEIFNPQFLFTIYHNAIQGYLNIHFSKDPTDYIFEDYGRLNKNLILTIDSTKDQLEVTLEREYYFDYDDIEDPKVIKQIQKLERANKANKKWKPFKLKGKCNYDEFNKKFTSHFKLKDIQI